MHAGVTVQAALMSVADELPSPIGDEVRMVKRDVNVSIPLEQALDTLAQRVNSRQMQFLVASIGIAVRSGSDLVPQLVVIEEIVQQRARIEGKIKSAIALAKPTAILAMAAPVIMMLYMSFTDPGYLAWFFGPGILFLGISIGLYAAGVVTIRILVKNVENT
jgi:tight adherence protein B